jgi:hypothetical protein
VALSAAERHDYRRWHELEEDDRNLVRERITNGELPTGFRVTEHLFYVGQRRPYLSPTPIVDRG